MAADIVGVPGHALQVSVAVDGTVNVGTVWFVQRYVIAPRRPRHFAAFARRPESGQGQGETLTVMLPV